MKLTRISVPLVLFVLVCCLYGAGSAYAGHCGASFVCDDSTGMFNCQIDCSTWTEAYYETPMTPSTATSVVDYPINDEVTNCTPGAPTVTASVQYGVTEGTDITVSASGSFASTVGASLGVDALAAIQGSGTWTISGSWGEYIHGQWNKTWTANYSVAACKKQRAVLTRTTKSGNFAKSGRINWSANVREVCYVGPWNPGSGYCDESNANAGGNNKIPYGSLAYTTSDCTNCSE